MKLALSTLKVGLGLIEGFICRLDQFVGLLGERAPWGLGPDEGCPLAGLVAGFLGALHVPGAVENGSDHQARGPVLNRLVLCLTAQFQGLFDRNIVHVSTTLEERGIKKKSPHFSAGAFR